MNKKLTVQYLHGMLLGGISSPSWDDKKVKRKIQ